MDSTSSTAKESRIVPRGPSIAAFRRRRHRKAGVVYGAAFATLVALVASARKWGPGSNSAELAPGRMLSSASCSAETLEGGPLEVAIYMIIVLYAFVGLAIVCDDWFVDSLEHLSEEMKLSDDVAGATFMAAGSSAPELFTSIGDVFGPSNNIGIGTIVGSAMFNILVIVALAAAVTPHELPIDWRPIARDVTFYSIAIGEMVIFFWPKEGESEVDGEGHIYFTEALIMVLTYCGYIVFMAFNARFFAKCEPARTGPDGDKYDAPAASEGDKAEDAEKGESKASEDVGGPSAAETEKESKGNEEEEGDDDGFELWKRPTPFASKEGLVWAVLWPYYFAFTVTIPKFNLKVCFFLSILWIGLLCWIMVDLATRVGCILEIPPQVMGIVVLAVGTSVPDALGSMIEAKEGKADMAIANAVGSNVFDILLGLGLPWMVKCAVEDISNHSIKVDSSGIVTEVIVLYATVALFATTIAANKFKMNQRLGKIFLIAYLAYIGFIITTKVLLK